MKKVFILCTVFLFVSCKDRNSSELMEIPVDTDQNISLPLSIITEEIKAIELELTDESLINPDRIIRVLLGENHVIVAERDKISVFSVDGKFVRSIGSRGQGPGEFIHIRNLTMDEANSLLFVNTTSKIICYDLDGFFLKESSFASNKQPKDINYIEHELLLAVAEQTRQRDSKGLFLRSAVYQLNNELQIADSCIIRDTYFEKIAMMITPFENFIVYGNGTTYLYYPDIYINEQMPLEVVLRDTLYCLKNNSLIPELKLKFKNEGINGYGNKYIQLLNIYRSSQYVFAFYRNDMKKGGFWSFCYDIKTGKGYNMQDGYTDDINKIEKRIRIHPLTSDSEYFYYWYTHIKPDDREEPNPTLYIGKLKQ